MRAYVANSPTALRRRLPSVSVSVYMYVYWEKEEEEETAAQEIRSAASQTRRRRRACWNGYTSGYGAQSNVDKEEGEGPLELPISY